MSQYEYTFDEDVENNFNEDRIPDILNPYVDQDAVPLPTLVFQESTLTVQPAPKPRKRPQPIKKKLQLSVRTESACYAHALLTN
jgi:hypothetical protein